jgi:hypothetical protein
MAEQGRRRSGAAHDLQRRLLTVCVLCALCLIAWGTSMHTRARADGTRIHAATRIKVPKASRAQSRQVTTCMRHSGLTHSTANATYLWVGWAKHIAPFVYVQLYPSSATASKEGHFLRAEESGVSGRLLITQHITPYVGSPVPRVVKCLHGKMISKQPHKRKQTFKF